MKVIKLAILGAGGVGKSAILIQFIQDHFVEEYDPTIEDFTRKQIYLEGNHYLLEILDTAGQDEYYVLMDQYLNYGDGFLLVYDITDESSFEKLKDFKEKLDQIHKNSKIVLCGNKSDLMLKRKISYQQGLDLANQWNCKYYESSAKTRTNIDILFQNLILSIDQNEGQKIKTKFNKRSSSSKTLAPKLLHSSKCALL